ncbi:exo-alpha-sialidase [Azospirillum halopraeferens]|uniref:exo-alpha-sialidase n=1 Tax=Azospirillum halopraeferens TaxID=34010 RepID=UPI00041D1CAD|nr:sialidase family protein [Azospirillum halopraeferens]
MTMPFAVSHRIIYRDSAFFASFPSVALRADGVVLVAFRRARDHRWLRGEEYRRSETGFDNVDHLDARSQTVIVPLTAGGEPAGEPITVPPDPQAADQDANLLVLRDGRLVLTGFAWYPLPARDGEALRAQGIGVVGSPQRTGDLYLFWGAYARWSDDGGRTWTPHRYLPAVPGQPDTVPGIRPMHGGAVRGRAVEAADGTLLMATYAHHPDTGRYASHLFASADRGDTWTYRSLIAMDRSPAGAGFCESALLSVADGRLLAFHRTTGLDDRLAISASRDLGRTWEPWRVHEVVGHPYDACPLADGRLLLAYGYRHRPFGVRARLWNPVREDPAAAAEFIVRDDSPSADTGYPWAVALPDGRALVVYYICDDAGVRHVAASLLTPAGP